MKFLKIIHQSPLKSAIILYLLIVIIILIIKPKSLFDSKGNSKQFGVGREDKTIFPVWLLFLLIAIICYYFTIIIKIFY